MYLEHSDESLREAIKGAARFGLVGKIELPSKHLHTEQGEDDNEEEQKKQQAGNGTDRVQEGSHQITERCPVSRVQKIDSINHKSFCHFFLTIKLGSNCFGIL